MKNSILVFIILIFVSCSSTNKATERRCKSILKNDYKNILEEKFKSIVNNDTITLSEIKYECVHTAMYTKKVMYDKFGKWNREIYPKGQKHPILLWENVKLFPNDTTVFIVAANGLESYETIYASVLVFDNKSNDLLSENSRYKSQLIKYFSDMIRSNDPEKKDFYEMYWKRVDSSVLQSIKNNKKK